MIKDMIGKARKQLIGLISDAVAKAAASGALPDSTLPDFVVGVPTDTSHGDFASNAAMVSARQFKMAPAKIAVAIIDNLDFSGSYFERAETAGPGFLNFFLSGNWFSDTLLSVQSLGSDYGRTDYGNGKKVMVEFVSANPTGPMHMGNARGGALGDCLAAAMDAAGYDVSREFYVNDAGNQIDKFGFSLEARYLQIYKGEDNVAFPEDGYHGDDIRERAQEFADLHGDKYVTTDEAERRSALVDYALPRNIERLRNDLLSYRVEYDTWFFESMIHSDGTIQKIIDMLSAKGLAYENDGALWYKATEFGAEKDEVLIRSNGSPTYFAADIAYHYNKFTVRGFSRVINLWGSDHHGHVARLKGAMDAIGLSGDDLDIVLFQFVRLLKNGEPYKMSKRTGKSITLSDIIDEVPVDAARFFFISRETGSVIDFDMDLAIEQSSKNPVYYVQYAHARICSLLKKLESEGVAVRDCSKEELSILNAPEEIELIRLIAKCPGEIIGSCDRYDPAGLTRYVTDVATQFHKFYTACRVLGESAELTAARAALCVCARIVIRNVLFVLKITAPESM